MKKADKWTPAMAKATKARDNAKTPAAKAKAQKAINAAYKNAGLDMKGKAVKKKVKAMGGAVVKKKVVKPTATKKPVKKPEKKIKAGDTSGAKKILRNAKLKRKAVEGTQKFINKMEREEYNKKTKAKLKKEHKKKMRGR